MDHDQLVAAIRARHAVRRYLDQPIPGEVRAELDAEVARCNAASGLNMHLVLDEPAGFKGGMSHYGTLVGVRNYLALVHTTGSDRDTACGYWGQHVVLLAQHLGLNSCWVGLTYNKRQVKTHAGADEKVALVVALGYGETPGHPHKSKPIEKLGGTADGSPWPDWFRSGVELAALAPTGLNQQKFFFELDGTVVRATPGLGSYTKVDLGIARYHFEIGATGAQWQWADGA